MIHGQKRNTALQILVGSSFSNQAPFWKLWWRKRSHLSKLMSLRPGPLQDTVPHQLSQCPVLCLTFAISTGPAPSLGLHGRKLRIKGHTAQLPFLSLRDGQEGKRNSSKNPRGQRFTLSTAGGAIHLSVKDHQAR